MSKQAFDKIRDGLEEALDYARRRPEPAPTGIPDDIWTAALASFRQMQVEEEGSDDRVIIARAIMAERDRCGTIAEFHHEDPTNDPGVACEGCGEYIAELIRSGATPEYVADLIDPSKVPA